MKRPTNLTPGVTYPQNVNDTVYTIPHSKRQNGDMRAAGAKILVETNDGRQAYGVDPAQGGLGYPVTTGTEIELNSYEEIMNWRFINDAAATPSDLTITIFYKK